MGPDGFQDARLALTGLSTKLEIRALTLISPEGPGWEYGLNPKKRSNAELVREKDRSRGSLFFSPDRDLRGQTLALRVLYANDRSNSTVLLAGATDPQRTMPKPSAIRFAPDQLSIRWIGQQIAGTNRGDIQVMVDGLPAERAVFAAALSDKVGGFWIFRRNVQVSFYPTNGVASLPLDWCQEKGATAAALFFPPYRDETETPMVLRLLFEDGSTMVHRFSGQPCDPYERGPWPEATRVEARPGDDLQALAERFGAIHLASGRYLLSRPLVLNRPVAIPIPTRPRSCSPNPIGFTTRARLRPCRRMVGWCSFRR